MTTHEIQRLRTYQCDLFATKANLEEAMEYATMVARASDNPIAVLTAVRVVLNTLIQEVMTWPSTHQDT